MSDVKELNLRIDDLGNKEASVQTILSAIRPGWKLDNVVITALSGGFLNTILRVRTTTQPGDELCVRVFSPTSEKYIDHDREIAALKLLSERKVCSPLYCRFLNGYVYKYENGATLSAQQYVDPNISNKIIERFHALHSTDVKALESPPRDAYTNFVENSLAEITADTITTLLDGDEKYTSIYPPVKQLMLEADAALALLQQLSEDFPAVLCHNDAHRNNIVYNPNTDSVTLIDWDLMSLAPEPMDIGYHFGRDPRQGLEAAGKSIVFDENFQRTWLNHYLNTHPALDKPIPDEVYDKWMDGVQKSIYLSAMQDALFFIVKYTENPSTNIDEFRNAAYHYNICKQMAKYVEPK